MESNANGKGPVVFAWHPQGIFLATCGANKVVNIVNRQGEPTAEIPLEGTGRCMQLDWDPDGEKLAILQQNSSIIRLWDANMSTESSVDTNQKDLSYIKWAKNAPLLAIGTQKGTLCLYDKRTLKKQSLLGKHAKRISSGTWNDRDELVLASDDRQLTLSDQTGTTLLQQGVKGEPSELRMSEKNISAVLNGKSLVIYELRDSEQLQPLADLTFAPSHGPIAGHEWMSGEFVVIGFESGCACAAKRARGRAARARVSPPVLQSQ